jgi:TolB protein
MTKNPINQWGMTNMRFVRLVAFLLVWMCLLAWGDRASAVVYIDIDSPGFQKYPLAIADLQKLGGSSGRDDLSTWFSDNLSKSLEMTGFFNIISRRAFLEDPKQAAVQAGKINFADWSVIGADYLVKGGFSLTGRTLITEFRLYDVVKGELLIGRRYVGQMDDRKEMVRKFAREILVILTGDGSVFDTKIAFVQKKGPSSDIYTIHFDGSDLTRITSYGSISMSPRWSPDGQMIAFMSYKDGNPDLYVRRLNNSESKKIAGFKGLNLPGTRSPDGRRILMTLSKDGNEEIYMMDVKTGQLTRLTHEFSIDVSPVWSPDGQKIAFVSNRAGTPQIYTMNQDGTQVKRLTYDGSYNTSPSWSPKGNRIAFEGRKNGRFQIFTVDENGRNLMQISPDAGEHESPSWSPDGRYLTFSERGKGAGRICVTNANGANMRILHENGSGCISPAWSPRLK